jgi:NAD(P)-dependent dehydrogenase (short-subunit alcohol dehydrogenase family)
VAVGWDRLWLWVWPVQASVSPSPPRGIVMKSMPLRTWPCLGKSIPFWPTSAANPHAPLSSEVEDRLGPIEVLVNNAGRGMRYISERFLSEPSRFWEADPEVWRMVIHTNVNGPFFMSRAVVPGMISRGWGRIINISVNYDTMRRRGFSPYGPSKAALESETVIWAQDLAGTGSTVNALLPGGASMTGMIPDEVPPEVRARLISPEIMVPPLLWLVSNDSSEFTGKRLNASRWDPTLPASEAAARASEEAGWSS